MKTMLFAFTVLLSLALPAGTWYVDASRPDDAGDGLGPETAKRTLQAAVNAAEASGETELTVLVAPGTYAEGEFTDSDGTKNRVIIKKKLTLRSTGTRDDTFVVGAKTASNAYGLGSDSIRGICVDGSAAAGTVIQGFTFKDGSTADSTSSKRNGGGAVCFNQDEGDVYVKDCAAIDCAATYGGGFRGVIALRSLVKRCHNNNSGSTGSAMYNCKAYACVIDSCGSEKSYNEYILRGDGPYVNCTAVGNSGSLLRYSSSQRTYNVLSMLATRQEFDKTNIGGDYVIATYDTSKITHYIKVLNTASDIYKLLVSPLTGDYRPVQGGKAEGFGDPQHCRLDWIPEAERNLDYYGRSFDVSGGAGSIDCGAVQGAVAVSGGTVVVPRTVPTTGTTTVTLNLFHQVDAWPAQFWIADEAGDTFAVSFGTTAPIRYPTDAGGFWQTVPQSGALTVSNIAATARLSVGTEDGDYGTIQAAVDAASDAADAYTIIDVAPGEYGPVTVGAKNVRIRSTGGKRVTAIRGVKDGSAAEDEAGCGPAAVRCVTVESGDRLVCVEGFTLRDGATRIPETGDIQDESAAGAFSAKTSGTTDYCQLLDCDIVACSGFNSAAVWGGWLQRCAISNCVNPKIDGADSIVRAAWLSACVLCENDKNDNQLISNGTVANNCTVIALYRGTPRYAASVTSYLQGSIVCGGYQDKKTPTVGSVLHDMRGTVSIESGFVTGNPLIANPAGGMFTLLEGSSAIGLWDVTEKAASSLLSPWKYLVGDFDGQPMEFVDGKATAGAFQTRYVPKDVYVDAAKADDAGDGLAPETAKRTLAAAMAVAGCGDTVHAAAGTYDEGTMPQLSKVKAGTSFAVAARVSVPAKATLVGAGAGRSVIRGGFAAEGEGELIRCVLLADGATLRGFTVADGLCNTNNITANDDMYASGVLGHSTAVVEDCEISGCRSRIYGGVYGGTFRRCRFTGNWAMGGTASAGVGAVWENCLFTANRGSNIIADYERIANCTFLYDNVAVAGNRISTFGSFVDGAVVCNSALILSPTVANTPMPTVRNCLLPKIGSDSWRWDVTNGVNATDCLLSETTFANAASWDGVPDGNYVGLDRGANADAPEGTDFAGAQRIQNATVDIGCCEFDWMPTYSAAFSSRGWAEVTATAGAVTAATGGLLFGADGALTAKMLVAPGKPVAVKATVVGEGALQVKVNGALVGTLVAGVPRVILEGLSAEDRVEIAFSGAGEALLAGLKGAGGFHVIVR